MTDYAIEGADELALHHFYRAMAWLGEEIEGKAPGALAARCVKDVIEEKLFDRRRDLFTDLSLVFMDTTSLSFYGAGGETLGRREGRPICTEMVPGNTADAGVLLPVVDRLRDRLDVTRACVIAGRGIISAATIAALEGQGLEYILGARERSCRSRRERLILSGPCSSRCRTGVPGATDAIASATDHPCGKPASPVGQFEEARRWIASLIPFGSRP